MLITVGGFSIVPEPRAAVLSQGGSSPTQAGLSSSFFHSLPQLLLSVCLNHVACPMLLQIFAWPDHSQEVEGGSGVEGKLSYRDFLVLLGFTGPLARTRGVEIA